MSRFKVTTLLALLAALTIGLRLRGPERLWVLAALLVLYIAVFAVGMSCIGMQFFSPAICRGVPGQKRIALTFDDGPDPTTTPLLLDLLRREGVTATFFCIGRHVENHPEITARIVREGHLLGNHFFTHGWWTGFLRQRGLVGEMLRTQRAIECAAGVAPQFVRPPVGLTNPHLAGALRETGLVVVGWDLRTFDSARSAATVIERIRRRARDGSIIVLHDGGAAPAHLQEILADAIPYLRREGFRFARVDEMLPRGMGVPPM